jgi:hypothetical protein
VTARVFAAATGFIDGINGTAVLVAKNSDDIIVTKWMA